MNNKIIFIIIFLGLICILASYRSIINLFLPIQNNKIISNLEFFISKSICNCKSIEDKNCSDKCKIDLLITNILENGINTYLIKNSKCSVYKNSKKTLKKTFENNFYQKLESKLSKKNITNLIIKLKNKIKFNKSNKSNTNKNKNLLILFKNDFFISGMIELISNITNCKETITQEEEIYQEEKEIYQEEEIIYQEEENIYQEEKEIYQEEDYQEKKENKLYKNIKLLIINRIKKIIKKHLYDNKCKCYNSDFKYSLKNNKCKNNKTGKIRSICSDTSIQPIAETIIVEEEKIISPRKNLLKKISLWKEKWLTEQPICLKKIKDNDKKFIEQLIISYINYMIGGFKRLLGYVPNLKNQDNMTYMELNKFYILLKNTPKCNKLINLYNNKQIVNKSIPEEKENIKSFIEDKVKINKTCKLPKKYRIEKNRIGKTSNSNKSQYNGKLNTIDKKLNSLEKKIDTMFTQKSSENMKYLQKENDIKNIIEQEKKLYKKANNSIFSGSKRNDNKYLIDNEHTKFIYKNNIKFKHNEPSKKIASAYGWTYMPPQSWSVPQKRPPVCIPQSGHSCDVKPTLDKGLPIDALNYTKVGSILPKFEYKEVYNPHYYYPGWKSQDKINYPNNN